MEISIENSDDSKKYPEGVKAVFKLIRLDINEEGRTALTVLIDNHPPMVFTIMISYQAITIQENLYILIHGKRLRMYFKRNARRY